MTAKKSVYQPPIVFMKARCYINLLFVLFFFFSAYQHAKACTPLSVPSLVSQTLTPTSLLLDFSSNTVWTCDPYNIEVEIVCNSGNFTGLGPFYVGASIDKTTTPQAYTTQTISLSMLCPGLTYKFRAREVYDASSSNISSNWTQTFTFTMPGTFIPPVLNLSGTSTIVCPPQSSTLFATIDNGCGDPSQYSYAWTPTTSLSNPTSSNPVASPTSNTTYSCVVSGGPLGCWTVSNTIALILNPSPPQVGQAQAMPAFICVGKTTTLSLSSVLGNIQWQSGGTGSGPWSNVAGAVTNSFVSAPLTLNTCFRAMVSTCNGTITSNAICISPNPIPILPTSVMQSNCSNTAAIVSFTNPGSSGAPSTVSWSPVPTSVTTSSMSANYTMTGVGTVTVSFPDGCVSTASFFVDPFPPLPTFTFNYSTPSTTITCANPSITINALSNYTYGTLNYFWASANATFATNPVLVINAGNYTVTVTDPVTFCSETKTISITSNTTPPTSAISPTFQNITCTMTTVANTTATAISPQVNITHVFTSPLGGTYSSNSATLSYPLLTPGTYTYCLYNDINGCSTCKQITVTSNQGFPTFSVSCPQNFTLGCGSKSVAIINIVNGATSPTPGGPVSYTLLTPAFSTSNYVTGTTATYSTNIPGTYTAVTKDNTSACESKLVFSVLSNTFGPKIDSVAIPYDILDCANPTVTLKGMSSTPNVSYNWSFPGPVGNLPTSTVTVSSGTLPPTNTLVANYTLVITDNNNTCKSTRIIPIYQNKYVPVPGISNGGVNAITCLTPTITLTNISKTGIPASSSFPFGKPVIAARWDGPSPQKSEYNISTYLASTVGEHTLTVIDANNGCTAQTVTTLIDNRLYPEVNVPNPPADFVLDCGQSNVAISPIISGFSDVLRYQWIIPPGAKINNQDKKTAIVDSPGEYQIIVTNTVNGCSSWGFVHVINGTIQARFTPDAVFGYAPLQVNFANNASTTTGTVGIATVWSFGNGSSSVTPSSSITPVTTYELPGTYTVTAYANSGLCLALTSRTIQVELPSKLEIPNVFTPNNDGVNDIFFLKTTNLAEIHIKIYNRWEHLVYELKSNSGNIAWDGKNQTGVQVSEGVYFYQLKATGIDGAKYEKRGNITLTR